MSDSIVRQKKLLKNTAWFTVGTVFSKIITFLLVPLYTNILTVEQYSIADLLTTTVSLAIPFFSLIITEAVLRFVLDKKNNKKQVFTIGIVITAVGGVILAIISFFIFKNISVIKLYWGYFIVIYFMTAINTLESEFLKGLEEVRLLAEIGILQTLSLVISNIVLLVTMKCEIMGYLAAYIISYGIANICYFFGGKLYKYITSPCKIDRNLIREMLQYSVPMIPNSAMWWITNSSDRYLVSYMVSVAANGIMSVSYKIPSILSIVISVFMSAWQISVVDEFNTREGKKFFNSIYKKFVVASLIFTSLLIIFSELFATFMYAKEFFSAWKYSAILLLGFNFHAIAGFLGTAFTSVKNTKPLFFSTFLAAITNICLNVVLIKSIETIGAVLATVISYFLTYIVRRVLVKKYVRIKWEWSIIAGYGLVMIQLTAILTLSVKLRYFVCIFAFFIILILNLKFVVQIINSIKIVITKNR